jgi:CubicO group peptidase (beta-lactamase class C family)
MGKLLSRRPYNHCYTAAARGVATSPAQRWSHNTHSVAGVSNSLLDGAVVGQLELGQLLGEAGVGAAGADLLQ